VNARKNGGRGKAPARHAREKKQLKLQGAVSFQKWTGGKRGEGGKRKPKTIRVGVEETKRAQLNSGGGGSMGGEEVDRNGRKEESG